MVPDFKRQSKAASIKEYGIINNSRTQINRPELEVRINPHFHGSLLLTKIPKNAIM